MATMRLLLLSALLIFSPVHAVVIIVHGSFSTTKAWWKPGGDFFDAVEKEAKTLGHAVVPFGWSGVPQDKEITSAGAVLAKLAMSYPVAERIFMIGHSHGGNVIHKATHYLHAQRTSSPGRDNTWPHIQAQDLVPTTKTNSDGSIDRGNVEKILPPKRCLIDRIYLLGTPVSVSQYFPHLDIVDKVINLYSSGDLVQTVLGSFARHYPLSEHIANVEVFYDHGKGASSCGHSQLHDALMGRWLLYMPDLLAHANIGNFNRFVYNKHGHVVIRPHRHPVYGLFV